MTFQLQADDRLVTEVLEFSQRKDIFLQWTDEDLRDLIPNAGLRQGMLAELQPRGLDFFEEPLPHVDTWPDAPCAYVKLSEGYDQPAQEAQQRGWPYWEFDAGHFHMLVDAPAVTDAILHLTSSIVSLEAGPSPTL